MKRLPIAALSLLSSSICIGQPAVLLTSQARVAQVASPVPLSVNESTTINYPLTVHESAASGISVVQTGGDHPAFIGTNNYDGAWPAMVLINPSRGNSAQTQLFLERNDELGNLHIWQLAYDANNNSGFAGLFNIESIDPGTGVLATPISMARTGEVGIGTGVPFAGQSLTVGGDVRVRRRGGLADDGAINLGSNNHVVIYGNSATKILSFSADGTEAVRIAERNLLVGTTTDSGDRLQVSGNAKVTTAQLMPMSVASLPTCDVRLEGRLAAVTDSARATFNAVIIGGGSNHIMAYCNGTQWTVH